MRAAIGHILSLISLCLGACAPGQNDFCEFRQLPESGWIYGDTTMFVPQFADSAMQAVPVIAVRHSNAYIYSNLWLEIARRHADGAITRDTVNLRFSDIYGRWHGHGFGASYQYADTLRQLPPVTAGDTLVVRHIMRVDTLRDIEQLGVMFVPTEKHTP